ncbi:hypothetical protein G6F57_002532 [Rhizopus arrhizus]|nr:hypothetical protein G6F30_003621 [Rhizopus arrhizus]KAG1414795.1 hypothetical protein G6F58_006784 [Rhizopus delemar]KAG0984925.1 hypothetical protein G6F29_004422 [Rhizopus arrhizus]KAG0994351.1 hypothetical protein G6F28_005826 [Rhizopus arrhizus]KAG1009694.1 hypothetical protein G6F27_005353 [Rhizopus arrhizus]
MGVQGLWSLVGPAARPTQLESLRQRKVAVDASIWIHQFIRAMRDRQGNALQNGHLLGFFRRICKLLFYDIKPVFVFDGGAPSLKRSTIRERRKRREGIKINMRATARKILSAQVKSRVIMEEEKKQHGGEKEKEEDYVYYDQLEKSAAVDALRKNRKLDQYELPPEKTLELNKLDPRLPTRQEIKEFVDEFAPTTTDIDSETFQTLPAEIQYEIIQNLKLKSRQTSWARLDQMVRHSKSAMDFSKQQIKLLKHRNDMTQRVMQMNTVAGGVMTAEPARVAGERGREYVLYKNENLDQGLGWKLPGLSAADPMNLDPVEPPTSGSEKIENVEPKEEDKVKAAVADNPKLAALLNGLLSDDEEDVKEEGNSDQDDEPLLMNYETTLGSEENAYEDKEELYEEDLINNMGAYVDDEAIDQVISKIYKKDQKEKIPDKEIDKQDSSLSLDAEDFLNLWLSRVPDAFLYLYSFNNQYKQMLRTAIFDSDPSTLETQLTSIRKQYGKTREGDELALESLQFQESFLESVIQWKEKNKSVYQPTEEDIKVIDDIDENIILDDDDDQEFEFIDTQIHSKPLQVDASPPQKPVHIDISQSLLHKQQKDATINIDNSVQQQNERRENSKHINGNDTNIQHPVEIKKDNIDNNDNNSIQEKTETMEDKPYSPIQPTTEIFIHSDEETKSPLKDVPSEPSKKNDDSNGPNQGYDSEEELENNIQGEDDEYARFVSDIASRKLEDVKRELYQDMKELNAQQRKDKGNSDDITDQMIGDIQELLKLFGIPYIVSPMEAEAQCAALERLKLIEGTITDDSDVFLFGASRVYKNMFNQQRFVECYRTEDIEREMMLSRNKLVQLAYLLGSDYTEGIPGVGPVAAMEILDEFPSDTQDDDDIDGPLKKFKDWYNSGQDVTDFQKRFRKRHKDLEIPSDFPNPLVKEAYLHPTVDSSLEPFKWGQPQLDSLRIFLMEAFGWPEDKADEVLLPVLREMNKRATVGEQTSLNSFFNATSGPYRNTTNKHSSKRVQNIVENWRKQKKIKR